MTPKSEFAYIAPTYKQAKRIAWKMFKEYSRCIEGVVYNESELTIKYPNGSNVTLYGSDNVDSLRGIALWGCALDENSQQPSSIFSEVISKCLADHLGYCIWLGTPKGKNEFYKTYQTALSHPDTYYSCLKTIDDTLENETGKIVTNLKQALEDDRKLVKINEMTQDEFNQEWYCSFEAAVKGAYYSKELSKAREQNRITELFYDEYLKVHTVWDLGIGSKMAIGFYQRDSGKMRMIDYWEGEESEGIPQAIKVLQGKDYIYGKHFAPHDIMAKDISTGKTRHETAKHYGIKFDVVPKLDIDDGINAGRLMFARLWIDEPNCKEWLSKMAQYHQEWDEKRGMFLEKPYHDFSSHSADVHRYAAVVENQMTNEETESIASILANRDNYGHQE